MSTQDAYVYCNKSKLVICMCVHILYCVHIHPCTLFPVNISGYTYDILLHVFHFLILHICIQIRVAMNNDFQYPDIDPLTNKIYTHLLLLASVVVWWPLIC